MARATAAKRPRVDGRDKLLRECYNSLERAHAFVQSVCDAVDSNRGVQIKGECNRLMEKIDKMAPKVRPCGCTGGEFCKDCY